MAYVQKRKQTGKAILEYEGVKARKRPPYVSAAKTGGRRLPVGEGGSVNATRFIAAAALWLLVGTAYADFAGVVVSVLDGDTVEVLVDRKPVRVRLAEIDAPEKAQAFGTRSRQALAAVVFQQPVAVRTSGLDRYGRTIGTILMDGQSINRMMVAQGAAWAYRKYVVDRSLLDVEAAARTDRLGLWADPHAVAPWEWRAANREMRGKTK